MARRRAGPVGDQRGTVPAGDFLGEQHPQHLGGAPALSFGSGQHVGGGAADVWQPHPAQQCFQRGVQRGRGVKGFG